MKFKTFVTSSAVAVLGALSFNASATYCHPPVSGGTGGCDGTGVNFKAIETKWNPATSGTAPQSAINIAPQLDLKLSSRTVNGSNAVIFTFRNIGNIRSSITDIYFDDVDSNSLIRTTGTNRGIRVFQNGYGTKFAMDTVVQDLPAVDVVNRYGFKSDFSADSIYKSFDRKDYDDGVNQAGSTSSYEYVSFVGFLGTNKSLQNVIDSINNNTFQIGLNVATFNSTTCKYDFNAYLSENCLPPSPVPVPAAAWLFGSALIGFVTISNRRRV